MGRMGDDLSIWTMLVFPAKNYPHSSTVKAIVEDIRNKYPRELVENGEEKLKALMVGDTMPKPTRELLTLIRHNPSSRICILTCWCGSCMCFLRKKKSFSRHCLTTM
jgi:hypothetical protein